MRAVMLRRAHNRAVYSDEHVADLHLLIEQAEAERDAARSELDQVRRWAEQHVCCNGRALDPEGAALTPQQRRWRLIARTRELQLAELERLRADPSTVAQGWRVPLGGRLVLDLGGSRVCHKLRSVGLSPTELLLLLAIGGAHGELVSQRAIRARVWCSSPLTPHRMHTQVARLNGKLRVVGWPGRIVATPGQGYRLSREPRP